jgi:hypothetical protein
MENNHKKALKLYHKRLLKEMHNLWTDKELLDMFNQSHFTKTFFNNDIDAFLSVIIATDSSAYDCLTGPLEDMPLYINFNTDFTKEIATYRLNHNK